jgi:RimJ/RimL family protein N-acetyltransferase
MTTDVFSRAVGDPAATVDGDLSDVFRAAELGRWPAPDGSILAVPPVTGAVAAVVAFTAHILVAADVTQAWIDEQIPDGDLSAPLNPPFLAALTARTCTRVNNVDAFFLAPVDTSAPDLSWLTETDAREHPRVQRALGYRREVRVFEGEGGFVTLGHGLAGRTELSYEVGAAHQGNGLGRRLAAAARSLAVLDDPACTHVWAQVAPGNAASMRTVVAAGFASAGAEALLVAH